jgi:hypothetical protein
MISWADSGSSAGRPHNTPTRTLSLVRRGFHLKTLLEFASYAQRWSHLSETAG